MTVTSSPAVDQEFQRLDKAFQGDAQSPTLLPRERPAAV